MHGFVNDGPTIGILPFFDFSAFSYSHLRCEYGEAENGRMPIVGPPFTKPCLFPPPVEGLKNIHL